MTLDNVDFKQEAQEVSQYIHITTHVHYTYVQYMYVQCTQICLHSPHTLHIETYNVMYSYSTCMHIYMYAGCPCSTHVLSSSALSLGLHVQGRQNFTESVEGIEENITLHLNESGVQSVDVWSITFCVCAD